MTMRAAVYSSGMLARQRARSSVPPSLTISLARSRTYSSVPIGTPTTVTPSSLATPTSTLSTSEIYCAVGAWPFGGRATVLGVLTTVPMSSNSRRSKAKAPIVFGRDSRKAMRDIVHVREGFHSFALELLPETL